MPVDVAVVVVGPGTVRSLHSGVECTAPDDLVETVLGGIDDEFVLVDDRPAPVEVVWREALGDLVGGSVALAVMVFPSWWSARRTAVVVDAARSVATDVQIWSRAQAMAAASVGGASVVVEIAESVVAVSRPGAERHARPAAVIPRDDANPGAVTKAVAEAVGSLRGGWAPVVIDRAEGVPGAAELAAMLAGALWGVAVTTLGDSRALRAVAESKRHHENDATRDRARPGSRRANRRTLAAGGAAAVLLGAVAIGQGGSQVSPVPTTLMTEGRVAVTVPATWTSYRVTGQPGSARVQIASPGDPEAAVHITQSVVGADETLADTAETLRRALEQEPPGVFVDFRPADRRANRPAVTYREIRTAHHVRWAVLLDSGIRIGIGCQSAPGRDDAVRHPCELAVASARELTGTTRP